MATKTDNETTVEQGKKSIDEVTPEAAPLRDRVVMATRDADGNPKDHNPEFIGPVDDVEHAAKVQLRQQAVTRVDEGINRQRVADEANARTGDPVTDRIREVQDAETDKAEKQAEAEVKKLHPDA